MIGYAVWVLVGIALAAVAARWQHRLPAGAGATVLPPHVRSALLLCAIGGAILGAYGLQLPADLLGWAAPPPPGVAIPDQLPMGGRTVLGGLLGGWLGVEVGKRLASVRGPTGDTFALPLAVALLCGRFGCAAAGCCAGVECAPGWWAATDALGAARVPVQLLEAAFHALAAVLLAIAARRGVQNGRRLAIYLSAYAVVRFALEFWRLNPPVALGLSWHQFLALALLALAGGTWWRRAAQRPPSPVSPTPAGGVVTSSGAK
ncbi:MAG: prolipoprotein diacylglyceryl transferase family protein [Planctomycetota bacterium]